MAKSCLYFNVEYTPLDKLASGFWSHVYSVKTRPEVVMKLLKFGDDEDYEEGYQAEEDPAKFLKEISIQQQLEGIAPKIIDHWVCNDEWGVIIMERIETTLEKFFAIKRPSKDTIEILKQTFNIVDTMHSKGIIHQDLKLENIGLGLQKNSFELDLSIGTRYLYLLDFGEAILDDTNQWSPKTNVDKILVYDMVSKIFEKL